MPLGNSHPPRPLPSLAVTLQPVPVWHCLTVAQQYIPPATYTHTQKTHTLSLWHTFCAYFHSHSEHSGKHSPRPVPPPPVHPTHTHTNRRECFVHSLTYWAATEEREREGGWWEEGDGDRGITKRSREEEIRRVAVGQRGHTHPGKTEE